MIVEYLKHCEHLTHTEKVVRDYIIENPKAVLTMNIKELSQVCHASIASITRLCQKAGFTGYSEFKVEYVKSYKDTEFIELMAKKVPFDQKSTIDDVVEKLPYVYQKAVGYVSTSIDREVIMHCVDRMRDAQIIVFGTGLNKSLADIFSYKLEELGIVCKTFDSMHFQFIDALGYKESKAYAILLSHTGRNRAILLAAKRLKMNNIPTLLICNNGESEIAKYCTEVLKILPTLNTKEFSNTLHMSSTQYILDIFVSLLLIENIKLVEGIGRYARYYGDYGDEVHK